MTLSEELTWRGFANQTTFKDPKDLDTQKRTFYWGCDPSADSLTIGHLAPAMMAKTFIKHGYTPVLLVGGATGMVGDPKDNEERELKSIEEITTNKHAIAAQYKQIFEGIDFKLVDNYDWFKDIGYLDFLREVGKKMSMSQLLDREFVKTRVGDGNSGLSYAEFSYSLMQGYDYVQLFRDHNVTLQLCGADQWGNSVTGVDLIRKIDGKDAHVWSTALVINKSTGVKFGKSEAGAIWLDPQKTSAYQFYQFWLNIDDESAKDYLKIFTTIEPEEYDELLKAFNAEPAKRAAQKYLAFAVTKLIHSEQKAQRAQKVTEVLFGDTPVHELDENELAMMADEIPTTETKLLIDALVATGVAESNSEARRLVEGGAISINGKKVAEDQKLTEKSLVKKGKNTFILVI